MNETPGELRTGRPVLFRRRDPLRPHRAITGADAHIRWWERLRALIVLFVLLIALGVLLAVAVGLVFLIGRALLEILAG